LFVFWTRGKKIYYVTVLNAFWKII